MSKTKTGTISMLSINTAAAGAERLSSYGFDVQTVTFAGKAFTMTGRDFNDQFGFTMTVAQKTDEDGTVSAACEFMSDRRDESLKFSAGCDDFVSALCLAIDEQAHVL